LAVKYKSALCVYPYKKELKAVGFFPPIGIEYIAGAIEDLVESLTVVDLRHEKEPLSSFIGAGTDLVLISYNWDVENDFVKEVIDGIPEHVTVVVGGRHATESVDELFEKIPGIDAIVRGDGEETVREIVQYGLSEEIDGLSFKKDGRAIHNRTRKLAPVGSDFLPNRKLRRYTYEVTIDEFNTGIEIDLMLGSRGCPWNCKFCDFKFNPLGEKRKWSTREPESVYEEIKTIKAGVIGFADDIFTANMNWVDRLCDLLIEGKVKKKYIINARLEIARRPDVLKKMYKAGFMVFLMGVESAHDKTLKSMGKGFDTAKIRKYFKVLNQFNFVYHCYFIIGNIGETREEILEVVTFSRELGVDTLGLSVLRATRFSPLRDMVKDLDDYHIEEKSGKVYSDMLSVDDLQQIRRDVNRSFFSNRQILKVLRKMVIHRILTVGIVYKLLLSTARRKVRKMAVKRGIRMGNVVR
jgi:magnesium-protoporphyrin IX monomethyl ester (oxidative) cyclase